MQLPRRVNHTKKNLYEVFGVKDDRAEIIRDIAREFVKAEGSMSEVLEACIIAAADTAELALFVHYYHSYNLISMRKKE